MSLAGGLVAGVAARISVPRLFVGGVAGLAVCVGLLALVPGPWALLLVMFAVGWFVMPVQATTMTIVQEATEDGTRGRVAGALNATIQTATIGSMAAAGILADVIGMRAVFAVGALVTMAAALLAAVLFRGAEVRIGASTPEPAVAQSTSPAT
jgi:MFS family permease